jgi:hypothetical protein
MSKENNSKTSHALSFARQLGFLIVIPIAFFLFAGAAGDRYLGTHHLLLVLGAVVGVVAGMASTFFLLQPFLKDIEK